MNWHRSLEESSEGFAFGELIGSVDLAATATTVVVLTDHRCPKLPVLKPKIDGRDVPSRSAGGNGVSSLSPWRTN
jgi:hypothetical protein